MPTSRYSAGTGSCPARTVPAGQASVVCPVSSAAEAERSLSQGRLCFRGSKKTRQTELPVNQYGEMARSHWARWLPSRFAVIEDPDSFFAQLGEEAAGRISDLAYQLAGDDQPGEGYLGKAGRLGEARHRAEQMVLAEMILLEPEPGTEEGPGQEQSS